MQYTSTMTSKGQVTVPVEIRRKLKLTPGQPVRFAVGDAGVTLQGQSWREDLNKLHKKIAAHMKKHHVKPPSDEELDRAIDEAASVAANERHQRYLRSNKEG